MSLKFGVLLLVVLNLSDCVEDEWRLYENKFKHHNREEIYVANVTTDPNFKTNFTVKKWKTLNVDTACYNGGITNNTMLAILFSTISRDGSGIDVKSQVFDLKELASDVEFFQNQRNGNLSVFSIVYQPLRKELIWYSIVEYSLNKEWTWPMEEPVTYFNCFRMNHRSFLLANLRSANGANSSVIYEFTANPKKRWYYQSITLPSAPSSSCLSSMDADFYLSIVTSNIMLIYKFQDNHFVSFHTLNSPKIDQVVCFENGFKSFIAFNGLNAGVAEFTSNGLEKREILNSNLDSIEFWLPIPVNTYRDETILLYQRKLDHGTHVSFDVDVVTYNGNRFEDHVDIPCTLFGEHQNGLKCFTEYNSNTGIRGSSYIAVANRLALIVPGLNGPSTLFNLEVGLRKMEHPAKKELAYLLERKKMLQAMIDDQNQALSKVAKPKDLHAPKSAPKLKTASAKSNNADNPNILKLKNEAIEAIREIEDLKQKMDELKPPGDQKYATIIFNGPVEVQNDLRVDTVGNRDALSLDLFNDIVRKDQLLPIPAKKTFENLSAKEISFEIVNGVPKTHLVTTKDGIAEVIGNITFNQVVDAINLTLADGTVNGIDIDQWLNVDKLEKGPLVFDQLIARHNFETKLLNNNVLDTKKHQSTTTSFDNMETLVIPGNVTVNLLNGQDFNSFLRQLCANHVKCRIPNLRLSGTMNIQGNADVDYLNGLKFPDEYVGLDPKEKLVITGPKLFNNITRGYKVTTNSTINDVDLDKIVNLSGDQHIGGTITFDTLEVGADLKIEGKLKGKAIDKLIPNIGLEDTNNITANIEFRNLEVSGDIIIGNNFNGTRFDEYLDNIIVKNENATITGSKTFLQGFTVLNNFQINSNSINNISLDSIITKDTNQDLHVDSIVGNVDFDHLYVQGLFDNQNVTELNESLVKLTQNQTVDAELVFMEDVIVDTLVFESQNMFNTTTESLDVDWEVENIVVEGNVIGNIDKVDSKDLKENYLNYIDDQMIFEPYFIQKLTCSQIEADSINNSSFIDVLSYRKIRGNISDILIYRNATINAINVDGHLNVKLANGEDMDTKLNNHIWMKLHRNSSRLIIDGDVYFQSLEVQKLANAPFEDYVHNLVFKNETTIEIRDPIVFENGIRVKKLLETETLNDVALEHVLRKAGDQIIQGQIHVFGDVTIDDDVSVKEMINDVEVTYLLNHFDVGEESLKVKGEMLFERIPYIRNLTIHGLVNGHNFNQLQRAFAYTHGDIRLEKNISFNEVVHIGGNLGISEDINGVDLSEFVPRIVRLTQDVDVDGPIKFTHSVDCLQSLNVEKEVNTKLLFGERLEERIQQGVRVNQGLIPGRFHFENVTINENVQTKFINNLDMETIVPLKSIQQIDELDIDEMVVTHDFDVGGRVNGVDLTVERDRTLMGNLDQQVPSEIVFQNNVLVEDSLVTPSINGKPTSKIVTTNTDQNLTSSYSFNSKCYSNGHLLVSGLINGVNLTSWKNNAIPVQSEITQHIKEKWLVMEDLNLVGPLNGGGMVNDMNISKLVKDIKDRHVYFGEIEKRIAKDFTNMCRDVTYIYTNAQDQIYKFKYFEELQTLSFPNHINYLKYFEDRGNHYLLVNEKKSCFSDLMIFGESKFSKIRSIPSGGISQLAIVKNAKDLFLVSKGLDVDDLVCDIRFSTVVWKWTGEDFQFLASTDLQEILQESELPMTFYGLRHGVVTEFKINALKEIALQEYRKWDIHADNASFLPRGLQTGLALHTGKNAIFLHRDDPIVELNDINTQATVNGNLTEKPNNVIPGRNGGDIAVVNVGVKGSWKALLAVASHKKALVEHRLDIVEIYLDPFNGELFDQILTYRPSGLVSIEFGNGETLLVFLEDKKVLQIYEYKGIEGFKHRSSIKIQADHLFLMDLPIDNQQQTSKVLGLMHKGKVTLLQAVMVGTEIRDNLRCAENSF